MKTRNILSQSPFIRMLSLFALLLLVAAIIAAISFAVFPKSTTSGIQKVKQTKPDVPLPPDGQGIYDSCVVSNPVCIEHLNTFAAGGFKLVVNYSQMYASAQDQLNYAQRAQSLGMKIIWSINDPAYRNGKDLRKLYSNLATTCNCTDNAGFISYIVNLVKNLPVTYGYYIGDEVDPHETVNPGIHWLANLVKSLDPDHPRLTVAASTNTPSEVYYYYPPSMMDTSDIIGANYYPYGYITLGSDINTLAEKLAQNLQSIANQNHKQYFFVLQAFTWTHLCDPWPACAPFPSYTQMRTQRDQVLRTSQPRFILWYNYFDLLKTDNSSKHWADLVAAAGEISGSHTATAMPSLFLTHMTLNRIPELRKSDNNTISERRQWIARIEDRKYRLAHK